MEPVFRRHPAGLSILLNRGSAARSTVRSRPDSRSWFARRYSGEDTISRKAARDGYSTSITRSKESPCRR